MKVLRLPAEGTPSEWGKLHGQMFRKEINELVDIRLELSVKHGSFANADEAIKLAKFHLPVLMDFDRALHAEVMPIAAAAGCQPARLLLLNHFNDLWPLETRKAEKAVAIRVDSDVTEVEDHAGIRPPEADGVEEDAGPIALGPPIEDCSSVMVRTPEGGFLGHVWDVHSSARPYMMMMYVPVSGGSDPYGVKGVWAMSLTGCLGVMGINDAGVAVSTNGLSVNDSRIGVVWPAVVRRVLRERTAKAGRDIILNSPVGSGRHYSLADRSLAYGIETSGLYRRVVFGGPGRRYVHTNHALSPEISEVTVPATGSTSHARYEHLMSDIKESPVSGAEDLWQRMGWSDGSPKSVCIKGPSDKGPHYTETNGGMLALLDKRQLWVATGCLSGAEAQVFKFGDEGGES